MKKVLVLLVISLLLVGCVGGGGVSLTDDEKIHRTLDRFENAIANGNENLLASLVTDPVNLNIGYGLESMEKEIFIQLVKLGWLMTDIEVYELRSRNILRGSTQATVQYQLYVKANIEGTIDIYESDTELVMRKVGDNWLIETLNEL